MLLALCPPASFPFFEVVASGVLVVLLTVAILLATGYAVVWFQTREAD